MMKSVEKKGDRSALKGDYSLALPKLNLQFLTIHVTRTSLWNRSKNAKTRILFRILFTYGVYDAFDVSDSGLFAAKLQSLPLGVNAWDPRRSSRSDSKVDLFERIQPNAIQYGSMVKQTSRHRRIVCKEQNCFVSGQDESITRSGWRNLLFGVSENGCTVGRIGSNERFLDQICKLRANTYLNYSAYFAESVIHKYLSVESRALTKRLFAC